MSTSSRSLKIFEHILSSSSEWNIDHLVQMTPHDRYFRFSVNQKGQRHQNAWKPNIRHVTHSRHFVSKALNYYIAGQKNSKMPIFMKRIKIITILNQYVYYKRYFSFKLVEQLLLQSFRQWLLVMFLQWSMSSLRSNLVACL